jgi:feruloyl-CoA synthase
MLDVPPKSLVKPPIRPVRLGPADIAVERCADDAVALRSPHPVGPYPLRLTERLKFWATAGPDRVLFAKRNSAALFKEVECFH